MNKLDSRIRMAEIVAMAEVYTKRAKTIQEETKEIERILDKLVKEARKIMKDYDN